MNHCVEFINTFDIKNFDSKELMTPLNSISFLTSNNQIDMNQKKKPHPFELPIAFLFNEKPLQRN